MFARTERLLLRPGWPEDAPALVRTIGRREVITNLARAPWPYALGDAQTFLARKLGENEANLLIFLRTRAEPELVGGVGLINRRNEAEIGYWVSPDHWGRGIATEACRAVIDAARDSLRLGQLIARHFVDNPASGRVLRKLGFRPTGEITGLGSQGRCQGSPAIDYALSLREMKLAA